MINKETGKGQFLTFPGNDLKKNVSSIKIIL